MIANTLFLCLFLETGAADFTTRGPEGEVSAPHQTLPL